MGSIQREHVDAAGTVSRSSLESASPVPCCSTIRQLGADAGKRIVGWDSAVHSTSGPLTIAADSHSRFDAKGQKDISNSGLKECQRPQLRQTCSVEQWFTGRLRVVEGISGTHMFVLMVLALNYACDVENPQRR